MPNILQLMPSLDGEELVFVQGVVQNMSDAQAQQFASVYGARRKEPQTILLTTLLGFIGIAGIQRFLLGHIGMGLLYLFTGGICWIGTIIDLVNHKKLAFAFNQKVAQQVSLLATASS